MKSRLSKLKGALVSTISWEKEREWQKEREKENFGDKGLNFKQ